MQRAVFEPSGTLAAPEMQGSHAMKPVLVLQHLNGDGPAYLGTWLQRAGVPFEVRNTEAGDAFPDHLRDHGALAILGGEMSANDPLPSLRQAERLVREGLATNTPVIGHCLGGQLIARALGVPITASPAPEVGWQPLVVADTPQAQHWFGPAGVRQVFQWHFEAFTPPPGAVALAGSEACPCQAFTLGPNLGLHLGLQFHVEVDEEKLLRWSQDTGDRYDAARATFASVSSVDDMRAGVARHLAAQQALADRLYTRWLATAR